MSFAVEVLFHSGAGQRFAALAGEKKLLKEFPMPEKLALAIIGGSGLYSMTGLTDATENNPDTPFGKTSAPIVVGTLAGQRVAFLARHGIGHSHHAHRGAYRANIYALKSTRSGSHRQHQCLRLPAPGIRPR